MREVVKDTHEHFKESTTKGYPRAFFLTNPVSVVHSEIGKDTHEQFKERTTWAFSKEMREDTLEHFQKKLM